VTTVAVLPLKRFARAKQRPSLGDRAGVMRDMARRVLRALEGSALDGVLVVTADPEAAALAAEHGAAVVDEGELRGHSGAALLGIAEAERLGATRVLLVAGDCPLLTSEDVDALLERHRGPRVVVFPDRHGTGTNALLIEPPRAMEPAFGEGSRARHERLAREAGAAVTVDEVLALARDVDTAEDLALVRETLANVPQPGL
jgi:2-phospho-L-lactate/phosphoenolpyruvate guanylyltransferase